MTSAPQPPLLSFLARLEVHVAAPLEVGSTPSGQRRIIPLLGGTVEGPELKGTILPGGADYQSIRSATFTDIHARYVIETDEGDRIYVENTGIRAAAPDDIAALMRGEPVDPTRVYFRTVPRFETAATRWQWLNERLFVGTGARHPDRVELNFFMIR